MNKRQREAQDDQRYGEQFRELQERGAAEFGLLWFLANRAAVDSFRSCGYGDELERRGRMAFALSRTVFHALLHARGPVEKVAP